jgi:hypothetical protein
MKATLLSLLHATDQANILSLFNLETFINIFQVELIEYFQRTLAKMWNCTNDGLESIAEMTVAQIRYKILGEDFFIRNEPKIL